jgi:hypothetical protein
MKNFTRFASRRLRRNELFRSWVSDIDISALLSTADLKEAGQVSSLLNSSRLDELAAAALHLPDTPPRPQRKELIVMTATDDM